MRNQNEARLVRDSGSNRIYVNHLMGKLFHRVERLFVNHGGHRGADPPPAMPVGMSVEFVALPSIPSSARVQ